MRVHLVGVESGKLASVGWCANFLVFLALSGEKLGDHAIRLTGVAEKVTLFANVASLRSALF